MEWGGWGVRVGEPVPPCDSRVPAAHLCPALPRALGLDPQFPHQQLPAAPGTPALQRRPGLDRRRQPACRKDPRPTATTLASGHPASSQCPQCPPRVSQPRPAVPSAQPGFPIPFPAFSVPTSRAATPPMSAVPAWVLQPCPSIPSAHPGCPIPTPLSPVLGVPTLFLCWQIPYPSCHWTDRSPWNYSRWLPGHPLPGRRFCTTLCTNSQWGLSGGLGESLPVMGGGC